ncbi:efflux RND transporter periplasmic adaptor subunit [Fulvivirga imtechensis]|uniref:efflux RND transporter periplasmic adaptor subunit n=1 Tax=Fulvivirga imtechensis TaxID=881893 RepID=UPI00058F8F96|nr:HlyD family efflux transporter periplasmic adaptor subunit [Fulvivirga imtechensis]
MLQRLLLTISVVFTFASCNNDDQRIQPKVGSITESVYASVTLQPEGLYSAYAAASGIVAEIYVKEGDAVQRGGRIMQITNDAPQLNMENARLALELARNNYKGRSAVLKELEKEIEVATLKLKQDSINFFRQKNLWQKNIGTQNEYDARKIAYEMAQSNLLALENRYERSKNELETQLRQAENTYRTALIATDDYTVTSKIEGKVYDVLKEPGELVGPQEPVASIGSAEDFVIKMLIDEVDIARVKLGQRVLITLDAYGNRVFEGELTKIYPQKNERTQTFTAEARFSKPPGTMYPGLSGEANIVVEHKENALIIPRSYLINENAVKTDQGVVEVETGLYSMDEVEIRSGLVAGTYIYKP